MLVGSVLSATTYGWLVLAFPLAGSLVIAFGWRGIRGRTAGWIATAAIGLAFLSAVGALVMLLDKPAASRQLTSTLWTYARRPASTSSSGSSSTRCRSS